MHVLFANAIPPVALPDRVLGIVPHLPTLSPETIEGSVLFAKTDRLRYAR
ncbi:MAG: hypothetical protein AB4352_06625 [Hormoscilla sp.]